MHTLPTGARIFFKASLRRLYLEDERPRAEGAGGLPRGAAQAAASFQKAFRLYPGFQGFLGYPHRTDVGRAGGPGMGIRGLKPATRTLFPPVFPAHGQT